MIIIKQRAITNLARGATFAILSDGTIDWQSPNIPQPTEEQIQTEITRLQAEYDAEDWKRNRQAEYPSHEDCIHALLDGGDTLSDLQAKRQAVKEKYPKG